MTFESLYFNSISWIIFLNFYFSRYTLDLFHPNMSLITMVSALRLYKTMIILSVEMQLTKYFGWSHEDYQTEHCECINYAHN